MTPVWVLLGSVAGAIIGSFIATLILRWPAGRSVIGGRSQCDGCGRQLRASELLPIVSFVASRGRCRSCTAPIARFHLIVELSAAGLGGLALWLAPDLRGIALALLWWQLLTIALLDARHFWLPDRLTVLLAASGLALGGFLLGAPLQDRIIGGMAGFAVLALIAAGYRRVRGRDGLGGGDPKLLGAIGCWLGWSALAPIVLIAGLVGIGVAIAGRKARFDALPFGTFLAAGGLLWSGLQLARAVAQAAGIERN